MKKKFLNLINEYFDSLFLGVIYLCSFLSIVLVPLKFLNLSSVFHKLCFISVFLWLIFRIIKNVVKKNKKLFTHVNRDVLVVNCLCFLIIFFCFLSLILDYFKYHNLINFEYLTKPILFISVIIMIALCSFGKFKKGPFILLKYLIAILSVILIGLFIFGPGRTWGGLQLGKLLTLNFSNPNSASLILTISIIILSFYFLVSKYLVEKIILLLIVFSLLVLNYFTSCRNGFIAIFLCVIFLLFFKFYHKKNNVILTAIICLPLIFLSLYFLYFAIKTKGEFYVGITNSGKDYSSRFEVWYTGLNLINFNPLVGNFNLASSGTGTFQLHNCFLDLLVSYGFITLLLTIFYIAYVFSYVSNQINNTYDIICFPVFLCVFFLGIFESIPFYAPNGIALLTLSFVGALKVPLNSKLINQGFNNKKWHNCDVLMINNVYGTGSTGKIVQDLHREYLSKGINSFVIYGRNSSFENTDKNILCIESLIEVRISQMLNKILKTQTKGFLFMTYEIIFEIKRLNPKIVHIHSLNDNFVNYKILLSFLAKNNIKTVYTNHSEYMYLGNCGGHAFDCNKFIDENCQNCPLCENKKTSNIAKNVFNEKMTLFTNFGFNNLCITSVSPWLNERSKASSIFKNFRNFTVLNCTNIKYEDYECNKLKKPLVLNVTPSVNNLLKGFDYFKKLAELNNNFDFIVLSYDEYKKELPNNIKIINGVNNKELLSKYYHDADVVVITSKKETFSMPVVEALCCGTPVVGFKAGGPESICLTDYCSFVEYGNLNELNNKLNEFILNSFNRKEIIQKATNKYSVKNVSEAYISIYKELNINFSCHPEYYSINI